ncbi:tetratricopeptide repeat protein [Nodosilinea sp. P-1105]|uniref:ATP-binding protein n=1 Tax=Nodosilinea sp. P-1105 TaxID=2546229 RepID=UPI00146B57A4|nr:tetratricopeptide repeat protein [Nodosilinea sp. P-1105]NMF81930.1 tetratricopeptide repeat protein [Nodosilinea sp. P-1105]
MTGSPLPDPYRNRVDVSGDRNLAIGLQTDGTAIANVEKYEIHQPLPPQLSRYQLPNDIADFTGREAEVNRILARLHSSSATNAVVISAVAGMAGVGKSALAVHAAHRLKAQFPDARLYANLRGADNNPVEPFDVLGQWLRALGRDDSTMPPDLPGRVNAYRSAMTNRQALVLLDNAQDEAQVTPLLPGSGTCSVLVTSRRRLGALAGADVIDLMVLSEPEALALLQALIGDDRIQSDHDAAQRIVNQCGRLPLTVRIAGGTLKTKPHWSLASYAEKLANEQQRLAQLKLSNLDVRASFALSYGELADPETNLFCLLGLLPRDFDPEVAVALAELESEATTTGLEMLVDAQLVEALHEGRYQLHDLVRLFAQENLDDVSTPAEQQEAKLRVMQWYWEQANFWENTLNSSRRRKLAQSLKEQDEAWATEDLEQQLLLKGLAWFEQERTNVLSAVEWAYQAQAWSQVISFVVNLVPFFSARSYWNDWVKTHQWALEAARQAGDQQGEAQTLNNLGLVYSDQGRWAEAIELYEQSLAVKRELGDRHGEAQTLGNLGNVYSDQGRWAEAIELYEQSLAVKRELGDRHGEAQTLNNLGMLYAKQGQRQQAVDVWRESLDKLHPDSPDAKQVAQWLASPDTFLPTSRRQHFIRWIIGITILAFIGFNLWHGHWFIAVIAVLIIAGFVAFRAWRTLHP